MSDRDIAYEDAAAEQEAQEVAREEAEEPEPASALLRRLQYATLVEGHALIEADRAAVREPLERRVRELEEQAEGDRRDFAEAAALDFPGGKPTREDLIEGLQWAGRVARHARRRELSLEAQLESAREKARELNEAKTELTDALNGLAGYRDRLASLEAQLASAREKALREAVNVLDRHVVAWDELVAKAEPFEVENMRRATSYAAHARNLLKAWVDAGAQPLPPATPQQPSRAEPGGGSDG